ncbi:MAG: hypothetical protein Q8868_15490, partial [Bacteroidota bacterium]|nr:hypothetical protein [Bacteroidota bacterium]
MRNLSAFCIVLILVLVTACSKGNSDPAQSSGGPVIINHSSVKLAIIPVEWISAARQNLHIAYSHTSHGSQLIDGMTGL